MIYGLIASYIYIIFAGKKMIIKESRALIIQPGALGDGILTLPLARLLLRVKNICHVDILGHREKLGFLQG